MTTQIGPDGKRHPIPDDASKREAETTQEPEAEVEKTTVEDPEAEVKQEAKRNRRS